MDRGYLWFAINNDETDYIDLSERLAKSIKQFNTHNSVCIVTNTSVKSKYFDHVKVMKNDDSVDETWKLSNEYKAFSASPFTHTIKLEADMIFTENTDWWWNHLWQHDQVFSYHCRNYKDELIKNTEYRKLFTRNQLPDVYSGLHYFRRSETALNFYKICKDIIKNWNTVKNEVLINCHDERPTTDVVYALANLLQDPLQIKKTEFEWFKFMHNKQSVNKVTTSYGNNNYLYPLKVKDKFYLGGYQQNRIVHYHDKKTMEQVDARIF